MSWPQMIAVPAVGARKPVGIFIVVDLPAPLGPRNPSTSPCLTVNDQSSTATRGTNFLRRLRISSIRPPRRDGRHDSKCRFPPIPKPPVFAERGDDPPHPAYFRRGSARFCLCGSKGGG